MSAPPNFSTSFEAEKLGGADTYTYQIHQRSITYVFVDLPIGRSFRAVDSVDSWVGRGNHAKTFVIDRRCSLAQADTGFGLPVRHGLPQQSTLIAVIHVLRTSDVLRI